MMHHPNHMESRLANDLVKPPPCLESPLTRLMLPSGLIMITRIEMGIMIMIMRIEMRIMIMIMRMGMMIMIMMMVTILP